MLGCSSGRACLSSPSTDPSADTVLRSDSRDRSCRDPGSAGWSRAPWSSLG